MKSIKRVVCFIMAVAVLMMAMPNTAEAKTYKIKTVKVMEGRTKVVKTNKKIKKVKICSKDKNFSAWFEKGRKQFVLEDTDYNTIQTVKVYYKGGSTQKYKIKTSLTPYANKVVNALKPYLADLDEGVRKITEITTDSKYEDPKEIANKIIKNRSDIQKKSYIISCYMVMNSTYSKNDKGSYTRIRGTSKADVAFKNLYYGNFKGVCSDGAQLACDICRYLGMKAVCVRTKTHESCMIYGTDKNGTCYWEGVGSTAGSGCMRSSLPKKYFWTNNKQGKTMSQKVVEKYECDFNTNTGTLYYIVDGVAYDIY